MARANGVSLAFIVALYICATLGAGGAIFEIQNKCPYTVWAAGLPGGGTRLESGQLWTLPVANDTERGRLWGRTGCFFDSSGEGGCNTGNCGSPLYCEEPASPPVTVVEYSLNQSNNLDFYDISLVEGFNLPMSIIPSNSSCQAIACSSDINAVCPAELKVVNGCYSACTTFNTPQYCCTGEYSNNCSRTNYSKFFKDQCPQAYSYAMEDATSTFNCSGGNNYKVVFCGGNVTSLQAPPGSTNSAVTPLSGNSTPPSGVELPDNCKKPSKIVPILVGSVVGTALFVILCLVFGRCVRHRKSSVRTDNNLDARENFGQVSFDYKVLRDSTENFDRKNMLGKGGFGEVYKGILPDGRVLAVKKLNGRQTTQAAEEFLREVRLILSVRHRNLVRLLGCCKRGHKRLLVYEFMSNNSLDKHLFGEIRNALSWENRLNIIVGTARGLAYLHGESNVRIIHRDIKCANILLDDKLHPKIADFGLARFFPESQTHVSTRIGGTIGYTAPEYAVHGQLTEKADVYSYGIVVLEIVSGRKCVDARLPASLQLLLEWRSPRGDRKISRSRSPRRPAKGGKISPSGKSTSSRSPSKSNS